jgi:hypothetical protein
MRQPQIVRTTLGDLIAAVTEEVTAVIGDSPGTYIVVSYVVSDLLSRRGRAMARAINRDSFSFSRQFGGRKPGRI